MKIIIVSGYFNPLHGGHLDVIEASRAMGDKLIVIVNNDVQQLQKKGKIILDEANRLRLVRSLRDVDEAVLSIDSDRTIRETLLSVAKAHPSDSLTFANGGDRSSPESVPEYDICKEHGIAMKFGVGGDNKYDSSTRINKSTGAE